MTIRRIKERARTQIVGYIGILFLCELIMGLLLGAVSDWTVYFRYDFNVFNAILNGNVDAFAIEVAPAIAALSFILSVATILIAGPFTLSRITIYSKVFRHAKVTVGDCFSGFKANYGKAVGVSFLTSIYIFLWALIPFAGIFFVIVKSLAYSMSMYVLQDNPYMSVTECITESQRIMDGRKGKLFLLGLSFFGWLILAGLTAGILMIWLYPYMQSSMYNFYMDAKFNGVEIDPTDSPKAPSESQGVEF
jgi:uncharacterized membrane protein